MRRLLCREGDVHSFGDSMMHARGRAGGLSFDKGYLFLGILTAVFCYLFCFRYGVFGSKVDWISQHSVLPDYFRQQFYDTGELFPEFAANIGGGQNIYHFAYYGLYNPVLMLSYLLPFVKMSDYMMAVQFISLLASVLLMYAWLGRRGFPQIIRLGVTVMFLLSGPMIYHSYSQVMFVNYMPFLIMGLWGADRYFECRRNKRPAVWLTTSIFLMILTSFYFSIGGMLVLVLYGIHRFLAVCDGRGEKITFRLFFWEGVRFAVPFVLAVMMSGILLVPTALTLTGRGGESAGFRILELLIPSVPASRFCYSTHGIGLTTLALTALIAMLFGKKLYDRVLAWGCMAVLTVPVFAYLLNGGLYVRDKAMIPFLPLLCFVLACYLDDLGSWEGRFSWGSCGLVLGIVPYILTVVLIYICRRQGEAGKYWKLILLDGIVMLVCFAVIRICREWAARRAAHAPKGPRAYSHGLCALPRRLLCLENMPRVSTAVFMLLGIAMLILFGYEAHARGAHAVDRAFYRETTDSYIGELIAKAAEGEEGFYRTEQLGNDAENAANLNRIWDMDQYISSLYSSSYHEGYREFREDTFQLEDPFRNFLMQSAVHNPVYQRFMGVKYVVSDEEVPGYEEMPGDEAAESEVPRVYRNDQASPAAYTTDRVIAEETYRELEFPYNQLALLQYAVVKDASADQLAVNGKDQKEMVKKLVEEADDYFEIEPVELDLPERVEAEHSEKVKIDLPKLSGEGVGERVLFLRFRVKNLRPSKDIAVWVEGIRNKLTSESHFYYNDNTEFTYAIPLKDGQKSVEMVLGEGRYQISDAEAFLGMLPDGGNARMSDGGEEQEETGQESGCGLYQSKIQIDKKRTKGNSIAGTIDVEQPGYFITTIPYDENFEIRVDDQEVEAEEVNTAFLGFGIEAGEHEIEILYYAPGVIAGKILSAAGILLLMLYGYCSRCFALCCKASGQ